MQKDLSLVTAALVTVSAQGAAQVRRDQPAAAATKPRTGYVLANGINYYYEIHGQGAPLLLLHGGLGNIQMFIPNLPALAKTRQVIAVDLHGHGRTAIGDRPISLIDQGDDMAIILSSSATIRSTSWGTRWVEAWRCGSRCSIPVSYGGSCSSPLRTRKTDSIRRCCRSRPGSAPRWQIR